ncbi:MAG: hypothetical protein RLZ12_221 [Bacillota bacterium]|jgi:hypothetical protein
MRKFTIFSIDGFFNVGYNALEREEGGIINSLVKIDKNVWAVIYGA